MITRLLMTLCIALLCILTAQAQLAVTVSPVKASTQKAIVPLEMNNQFAEGIESARAVCFLLDSEGKVVGRATKWVIGGTENKAGLASGATKAFNFVITGARPFTSTNLTAKVAFNRVVLQGGRLADRQKEVQIQTGGK